MKFLKRFLASLICCIPGYAILDKFNSTFWGGLFLFWGGMVFMSYMIRQTNKGVRHR